MTTLGNQLKRAYSGEIFPDAAARFQWTLKEWGTRST